MIRKIILVFLAGALVSCGSPEQSKETNSDQPSKKIITAGGTITEMVNALGHGDEIIATDLTSTYPEAMKELPSIGYRNQIKAEGILAFGPDLVLIEEGYLNADVITQLKAAQVELEVFTKPKSIAETKILITALSEFFQEEDKGLQLISEIEDDLEQLNGFLATQDRKPKALFVMARGPETLFMAGEKTFASEMFKLAQLESTATGFDEFAPLSPESLPTLNPDFIVLFTSGVQSLGGWEGLSKIQGMDQTTAFQKNRVISMDGHYLSSFGPRVGKAALDLAKAARP
ncbi:heme/hemin ABC transporter substrate-binding protein [Algoriphagus halophilus]|uniref:Iron complex transport system substrate-binding protein n=1 Tax=Algoriphagus halophilus TaxID=226505 RepID=A0A1N6EAK5_9BACT|nr:ABC transporter substrate-binding protein [Algoriphagus halophilus]SIN80001.1 iron complex transport system substrate-binding protein [Algoriphagus halophilus]